MKNKDKHFLKALLLASISSIGIPVAQAAGITSTIARKEREGSDTNIEMVSEVLSNGILESHPSFGEMLGHTSHSSHSSHGSHGSHSSSSHGSHSSHTSSSHSSHTSHTSSSHTSHASSSHTSHTSSSGYDNGGYSGVSYDDASHSGSNAELKGLLIGTGAALAGVGVYALVKHIIKAHKKRVAKRNAENKRYHAYASRDLSSGVYGNDVDLMTELLIENGVLKQYDRKFSRKWSHYKYNRKVKRSVKRMQARMGHKRTGKASRNFLLGLKQWKETRRELAKATAIDSLDLMKDRRALHAVAILLVEKGLLKSYDVDNIMSEQEKSKIVEAYHDFLRSKHLQETSLIDEQKLRLLISLPNKHNEVI
jgi:hypothetical protein